MTRARTNNAMQRPTTQGRKRSDNSVLQGCCNMTRHHRETSKPYLRSSPQASKYRTDPACSSPCLSHALRVHAYAAVPPPLLLHVGKVTDACVHGHVCELPNYPLLSHASHPNLAGCLRTRGRLGLLRRIRRLANYRRPISRSALRN